MSTARKLTPRHQPSDLLEEGSEAWESFKRRLPEGFFDKQLSGENAKKFITAEEAALYLGGRFTEGAIRMKTHRGELPVYKIGSDVYYTRETLEMWKTLHFRAPKMGS